MQTEATDKHTTYKLRLYNADRSDEAAELALRLGEAVRSACNGFCDIEVIDVLETPEQALQAHVFATPMLVKELPEPVQRILGDINDARRVLMLLDVEAGKNEST